MKRILIFCALIFAAMARADNVELHFGDIPPLTEKTREELTSKALEIVRTSNFNTLMHTNVLKEETVPKVQGAYRKTVSDFYLLISFDAPREVKTVGGLIKVQEIVIGLSKEQVAGPLFTIDEQGRIIEHAKYSGPDCIKLMGFVRGFASLK
jgi:hypothetical protein